MKKFITFLFLANFCLVNANHTFFNWDYFKLTLSEQPEFKEYIDSIDYLYIRAKQENTHWSYHLLKLSENYRTENTEVKSFFNGIHQYYSNNLIEADKHFSEALSTSNKAGDNYVTAQILLYKGLCERDLNQLANAENTLKKADKIFQEYPDLLMRSHINYLLGTVKLRLSDYENAEKYLNQALQLREQRKDTFNIIDSYKGLVILYREIGNYNKCIELTRKSIELIRHIGAINMLGSMYNLSGSINWRIGEYKQALQDYKNALVVDEQLPDKKGFPRILNNIALVYKDIQVIDSALYYLDKSYQASVESGDSTELLNTFIYFGNVYLEQNSYLSAFEYYLKALELANKFNNHEKKAILYKNIGNIYLQVGLLDKSEENLNTALYIHDSLGQYRKSFAIKGFLADIYIKRNDYDKAWEILNELLSSDKEYANPKDLIVVINKMGNLHFEKDEYFAAVKSYNEALEISKEQNLEWHIANELNNLGNIYSELNKTNAAIEYFNQAISHYSKVGNLYGVALGSRKMGELYLKQDHLVDAMPLIQKSISIGEKLNNFEILKNGYYSKYQYHIKEGDFEKALDNLSLYHSYKDSSIRDLNESKIIEVQLQYELEEFSNKLNQLANEKRQLNVQTRKQEQQLDKQQNIIWFISIILIVLVVSALLLYRNYQDKKVANKLLDEKVKIIGQMNDKLTESEQNLMRLNFTKDKIFSIIAHDLKNPMGAILNASSLLREDYDNMKDEDRKVFTDILFESSNQLYHLLENLLQWSRNQSGRINYSPEKFDVHKLVKETITLFRLNAEKKKIKLLCTCEEVMLAWADKDMVNAVMRNLVSNAIKFTPDMGSVEISAQIEQSNVNIQIKDSGVGIDDELKNKLFDMSEVQSTKGTNMESGTGLGLLICKEFIEKNKGELWFETEQNKGTTFYFTLPAYISEE